MNYTAACSGRCLGRESRRARAAAAVDVRDSASACTADVGAIGCRSVAQSSDDVATAYSLAGHRPIPCYAGPCCRPVRLLPRPRSASCHAAECCAAAF